MQILICDDEMVWLEKIRRKTEAWSYSRNYPVGIVQVQSPAELKSFMQKTSNPVTILLDIHFLNSDETGIDLAEWIRKDERSVPILFITSDKEKAIDGYMYDIDGYVTKDDRFDRLDYYLDRIKQRSLSTKLFILEVDGETQKIKLCDIMYTEVVDHNMTIYHLHDTITYRSTISNFITKVDDNRFVQIHRSYCVNLEHIFLIKRNQPYSVTIGKDQGFKIPVGRKYLDDLLHKYANFARER